MNYIEKFSSLYRAYFECSKTHQGKLSAPVIKQLVLAASMMAAISVIIGLMTAQLSSFLYVYLSTMIIIIMLSYLYVYFAYQYSKNTAKHVHLFPWLKWMNMFFLYQLLILSIYYVQLVPILIILVIAIYTGFSIVFFNFVETLLDINVSTIISSVKTALLLFIGHSAFLYIIPIRDISLSFVLIYISLCVGILIKTSINKILNTRFITVQHHQIGILLLIVALFTYFFIQFQPKYYVDDNEIVFFNHRKIFRNEVKVNNQYNFNQEEILQLITDDTFVYVRTHQNIHILNHDLTKIASSPYASMTLVDTNHGVMLIEYHQKSDYPNFDGFPFSTYQITEEGQFMPFITFYIDVDSHINYIYFDQPEIIFFTSWFYDGELRYFDGLEYVDYGTYTPFVIENDDVYIEFNESYRYGLHRNYGMHTMYREFINGELKILRYQESILDEMIIFPYRYGYHHVIYINWFNQYYHSTSESFVNRHVIKNSDDQIFVQSDGSIISFSTENIYHYDASFNLISNYSIDGKLPSFENNSLYFIHGFAVYQVDVNDLGTYQVKLDRNVQDSILMTVLLVLFFFWQSYKIKPDEY